MYAYPMDSVVTYDDNGTPQFDRAVDSSQLRELYHSLMTDGVLLTDSSNLQVTVSAGMNIVVNPGLCNIQGCIKKFSEETPITIANGNATMGRIDTIVARLDLNSDYRDIGIFVIQGTPASVPTRPELTRNTSVYEIALADITISANATTLTQANISDTRLDTNRCGIISSIAQFDTTKLYEQIEADLVEFQNSNEVDFAEWFERMKEQLSEDAAGNLQLQIDDVNEKATEHIENTENPHGVTAEQIHYDKNTSGLNASNVQGAIDELKGTIGYSKKNLLPYPYSTFQTTGGNTYDSANVHWVSNEDGTVASSGTATSQSLFYLRSRTSENYNLKKGVYILSGCPSGGGNSTYFIEIGKSGSDNNFELIGYDYGNGFSFVLEEDTNNIAVTIKVQNGVNTNGLLFKPMIRYASIQDDTYEPFVQLGEIVDYTIENATPYAYGVSRNYFIKSKNRLTIWFCIQTTKTINNTNKTVTLVSDIKKTFGINGARPSFTLATSNTNAVLCALVNDNELKLEYRGSDVINGAIVGGQIDVGIY